MKKYNRGAVHLTEIAKLANEYDSSNASRMDVETVDGEQIYRVYFDKPTPEIGCLVGDFLHNMRSALDVATCTVVEIYEPGADLTKVQFPISKANDLNRKDRDWVLGVAAAVEAMQNIRTRYHKDLVSLGELSNQDKHRLISTAAVRPQAAMIIIDEATNTGSIVCSPDVEPELWNTPLKSGDIVGRGRMPGVGVNFPLALMVDDRPIKLTALNDIYFAVGDILHYLAYGVWPEARLPLSPSSTSDQH